MTSTAQTVDEFKAVLTDKTQLANLLANGGEGFTKFVQDSVAAIENNDKTLMTQVNEQVQATVADMLRKNGAARVSGNAHASGFNPRANRTKGALFNKRAPGAVLDGKVEDFAEFFQANWHNVNQLRDSEELTAKAKEWKQLSNSFSSTVPDAGGFLVPEEMRSDILQNSLEDGIVRQRATVIPMSSQKLEIPAVDETTHSGSVFGGIVAYWTEEGASLTESQATFGKVALEPSKLTIYCEAPNELIADGPAFNAWLDSQLPQACAFEEDYSFIVGNGVGQPLGALSGNGCISVTRTTTNRIKFQDVVNIYSRMLPSSIANAVWMVAPDSIPDLMSLVMPTGDATTTFVGGPLFLPNQTLIGPMAGTLLGRPVLVTEKVPAWKSAGDLSFVDFRQYLIGDRMSMTLTSSPHYKFASDKTAYKLVERVDGRPWVQSPITPKNGSANTLSPYVKLAA